MEGKAKEGTGKRSIQVATGETFSSTAPLVDAIRVLGERFNLVNPGGAIGDDLPQLYAAGISFVFPSLEHETYPIAGRNELGIGKTALERIAAAAGVRWNPQLCGRIDEGSSPHIVEYQAAGVVLQLDGTERMIHASKRVDLRAEQKTDRSTWGSDAQEIARIADLKTREPWPQILQARQHILSLAETKAKSRAIRSLGVRTSYTADEIKKGFAIVRLQFTGQSDDPEIAHEVAIMIARRALTAADALYGVRPAEKALPARTVPRLSPAKEVEEEEKPAAPAGPAPTATSTSPQPAEPPTPKSDPLLICGAKGTDGKYPKKAASQFSVGSLKEKAAYMEAHKSEWDPRWANKNQEELDAIKAWIALKEYDPRQAQLGFDQPQNGPSGEIPF